MNYWVAKSTLLPFEVTSVNNQAICLSILPIKKSLGKYNNKYIEIKNLQIKMLLVLDLSANQLAPVTMYYDDDNQQEQFSVEQKNTLTKKILSFYNNTKLILQFGNLDFLDLNYLAYKKIFTITTVHPEDLLQNSEQKRQAYQDLLLCKTKLMALL